VDPMFKQIRHFNDQGFILECRFEIHIFTFLGPSSPDPTPMLQQTVVYN